jgi:hypothetical protein
VSLEGEFPGVVEMRSLSSVVLGLLIALFLFLPLFIDLYTDYLWFLAVAYEEVFLTVLRWKVGLFLAAALSFFLLAFLNLRIAHRNVADEGEGGEPALTGLFLMGIFLLSLLIGFGASTGWETVLKFLHTIPFGITDPVFQEDLSFYFFELPLYEYLLGLLFSFVLLIGLIVLLFYLLHGKAFVRKEEVTFGDLTTTIGVQPPQLTGGAVGHLLFLGGAFLLLFSLRYWLNRFSLLYSTRGAVYGASYADVTVELKVLTLLSAAALVTALLFFAFARGRRFRYPLYALAGVLLLAFLGGLFTGLVHQYRVVPDEYNVERPYIERNIEFTRLAYGLDRIEEVTFPARYDLTYREIQENSLTIDNIRLWDWRPLQRTYQQLQLIRTYYQFNDVDIDRYMVEGRYRQVMISPREMDIQQLPEKSRSWINEHLVYTHGYGVTMSPVREVSEEGLPNLYIQDIPPKSEFFEVARPEIYYGEVTQSYAVVKTGTQEFDYPAGEQNVYTTYAGKGGVPLSSFLRRGALAARFATINLLVSESVTPESRILFRRDIRERTSTIAPFLLYDRDPYIVLSGGRLYWILDAYTVSDRFPYSEPYGEINYIRNSVKVVIDAYHGTTEFYIVDPTDPLIQTYRGIFPDLFRDLSEMPEGLKTHLRYPEDLFTIQAEKYGVYHMTDPRVFYNREDIWETPEELYEGSRVLMEPYYLITKLPGEAREEFVLLLPFTPRGKNNMISLLVARSDPQWYGERRAYLFPKDRLIYGPMQIEARIDQDTEISQLFTLWSQVGTRVIRGNLLAVPIEDSILYIEPIYLRAEAEGALPELKRVIVAFGDRLVMEETLEEALAALFGPGEAEGPQVTPPGEGPSEEPVAVERIEEALRHYEKAQEHLRAGNWSGYGEEIRRLGEVLRQLQT